MSHDSLKSTNFTAKTQRPKSPYSAQSSAAEMPAGSVLAAASMINRNVHMYLDYKRSRHDAAIYATLDKTVSYIELCDSLSRRGDLLKFTEGDYWVGELPFSQWYTNVKSLGMLSCPLPSDTAASLARQTGYVVASPLDTYLAGKAWSPGMKELPEYAKWTLSLRNPTKLREYYIDEKGCSDYIADGLVRADMMKALLFTSDLVVLTFDKPVESTERTLYTRQLLIEGFSRGPVSFESLLSVQAHCSAGRRPHYYPDKVYGSNGGAPFFQKTKDGHYIVYDDAGEPRLFDGRPFSGPLSFAHEINVGGYDFSALKIPFKEGYRDESESVLPAGRNSGNIAYVLETHGKLVPIPDLRFWWAKQVGRLKMTPDFIALLHQAFGGRPYPKSKSNRGLGEENIWHDGGHGARQLKMCKIIEECNLTNNNKNILEILFQIITYIIIIIYILVIFKNRVDCDLYFSYYLYL